MPPSRVNAAAVAARTQEARTKVLSQTELNRPMRTELMVLLHMIAGELASLENSVELRNAHANLLNIRRRLARPALTGAEIAVPRSVDGRHH
jgi:hypothetical protein